MDIDDESSWERAVTAAEAKGWDYRMLLALARVVPNLPLHRDRKGHWHVIEPRKFHKIRRACGLSYEQALKKVPEGKRVLAEHPLQLFVACGRSVRKMAARLGITQTHARALLRKDGILIEKPEKKERMFDVEYR